MDTTQTGTIASAASGSSSTWRKTDIYWMISGYWRRKMR